MQLLKKWICVIQTLGTIKNANIFLFTGPVFVELPIDVLYPYQVVHKELGVKTDARSVRQKIVNW